MADRQPYKPVVIDKKLGDVYFTDKCILYGPYPAPKNNPISQANAEGLARKCAAKEKKKMKIKVACLMDSLALMKKSRISKKPPYARIKYADVKQNSLFAAYNNTVVLCIQLTGKAAEYMAITFDKPLKATQMHAKLDYAALAPNNNLKNKIPVPEPVPANSPSPPSPPPVNSASTPARARSRSSSNSRSISSNTSSSGVQINEERPPELQIQDSGVRNNLTPDTTSTSRVAGLPRQPAYSNTISSHSSRPSSRINQLPPLEPSPVPQANPQSQALLVVEPVRLTPTPEPNVCSRCKSRSTSSSSFKAPSREKRSRNRQNESPTSVVSRHTLTTDASSHHVVDEEKAMFATPRSRTRSNGGARTQSTSSSSSSTSFSSNSQSSRRRYSKKNRSRTPSRSRSNRSQSLFILASGKFKPFSELAREQDNNEGMCSICGEVRNGGPKQVEIIRTDGNGGPMLCEDGTIYMYSKTRPVETNPSSREASRKPRKNSHKNRSRKSSRSSSSGRSLSASARNGYMAPTLIASQPKTQPNSGHQFVTGQGKKIYRLESNDSSSSSESSQTKSTSEYGKLKVTPLY